MAALSGDAPPAAVDGAAANTAHAPCATAPGTADAGRVAVVELLDRDGHVRQWIAVPRWPLAIGRALDNDLVLSDPHVAAHHLQLAAAAAGVEISVGDTRNGVQVGARRYAAGTRSTVAPHGDAVELTAGRTRLRLRLATFALAPELPLAVPVTHVQRPLRLAAAALALLAVLVFSTWLQNDPDTFGRAVGTMLLTAASVTAVWCSAWALLSKTFTGQAHFGWHLRVFVLAALGLLVVDAVPSAVAFAFSWPAVSDFASIGTIVVGAVGIYHHLLAVEPARHRLLRWVVATGALAGIALTLWFNVQRNDRLGDELYMHHLFPPALRVARPVAVDTFVDGLERLKPVLDAKAREPGKGVGPAGEGEDE